MPEQLLKEAVLWKKNHILGMKEWNDDHVDVLQESLKSFEFKQQFLVFSLFVAWKHPSKYNHDNQNWKTLFQSERYQAEREWAQVVGNIKVALCTPVVPEGKNAGQDQETWVMINQYLKEVLPKALRQRPASSLSHETSCMLFMALCDCHTPHFLKHLASKPGYWVCLQWEKHKRAESTCRGISLSFKGRLYPRWDLRENSLSWCSLICISSFSWFGAYFHGHKSPTYSRTFHLMTCVTTDI